MARLFRLSRLNDRFHTQVFTFQIPASILKENSPNVSSKEFSYGYQKWSILLIRYPKHIGIYLNLHNVLEGVTSMVNYTSTLVNNDHFTKNEVLVERRCSFTQEKPTHGQKSFMGVGDLTSRGFIHENGGFLMELELRNAHTTFDQILQLPREGKDTGNGYTRVESSYFSFGGFDWSLLVFPNGDCPENDGHGLIRLVRQTKFDHVCKFRYRLVFGYGDRLVDSEKMEHYVDITGTGTAYEINYSLYSLTSSKSRIHLKLDLVSVNAISEVVLYPLNRSKNRGHLYDVEKQAWVLESDISRSNLSYADIRNVPRKCLRHVTFGVTVLPSRGHHARPIEAAGSPFSEYFSQNDPDDSSDIPTEITSESKTWWTRKMGHNFFISARPTLREIKAVKEDYGFKTIVSVFTYNERSGEGEGVLTTSDEARIVAEANGMNYSVLLSPGERWDTSAAVGKLAAVVSYAPRPILIHGDDPLVPYYLTRLHFFNTTIYGPLPNANRGQSKTRHQVLVDGANFGFDFASQTNMIAVMEELAQKTLDFKESYRKPNVTIFPEWWKLPSFNHMRPVYENWFVCGQIQTFHLPIINSTLALLPAVAGSDNDSRKPKRITVINTRLGVSTNGQPSQEEVGLLNVKDGRGPYNDTDRQTQAGLLEFVISPDKPNSYISDTATINYETSNPLDFGDSVGYNETLERQAFMEYKDFIDYIHIPLDPVQLISPEKLARYRETLRVANASDIVLVHDDNGYRAATLALLAVADIYDLDKSYILERADEVAYGVLASDAVSLELIDEVLADDVTTPAIPATITTDSSATTSQLSLSGLLLLLLMTILQ